QIMQNSANPAYPFTHEELEAMALQMGVEDEFHMLGTTYATDGPWRTNSIGGYGTIHCKDIRVAPVNDKFAVVYWGGDGAETVKLWSFHIARFRPNATHFDPQQDVPLVLADENLRVLMETYSGPVAIRDGILIAHEGNEVLLEYTPDDGPQEIIPITFPKRARSRDRGGLFYL
ncbi:hypothetical protein C8J57DRAFT_1272082, partial [Mycena rebaudengoi]